MAKINSLITNIFIWTSVFVAVHGADSWIPANVLTPSSQCKKYSTYFHGQCQIPAKWLNTICESLPCAELRNGVYVPGFAVADDGTICGPSHVCKKRDCVRIPVSKLPKVKGSKKVYNCKWDYDFIAHLPNKPSSSGCV